MGSLLVPIVLILIAIAVVALTTALKGRGAASGEEVAYQPRKELFTPAERSLFGVLEQTVAGELKVFGKVRLGGLIQPARGMSRSLRTGLRNRINQKHVDFVLCRPDTLAVVGVVELDDASHGRKDRADRDDFVDKALASSGVPVLHFPARKAYVVSEVRERLAGSVELKLAESKAPKAQEAGETSEAEARPLSAAQASASAADVPNAVDASVAEPPPAPGLLRLQFGDGQEAGQEGDTCREVVLGVF